MVNEKSSFLRARQMRNLKRSLHFLFQSELMNVETKQIGISLYLNAVYFLNSEILMIHERPHSTHIMSSLSALMMRICFVHTHLTYIHFYSFL